MKIFAFAFVLCLSACSNHVTDSPDGGVDDASVPDIDASNSDQLEFKLIIDGIGMGFREGICDVEVAGLRLPWAKSLSAAHFPFTSDFCPPHEIHDDDDFSSDGRILVLLPLDWREPDISGCPGWRDHLRQGDSIEFVEPSEELRDYIEAYACVPVSEN